MTTTGRFPVKVRNARKDGWVIAARFDTYEEARAWAMAQSCETYLKWKP